MISGSGGKSATTTGMPRACKLATTRAPMKPVPPVGVEVSAADRTELENGLKRLKAAIDKLGNHPLHFRVERDGATQHVVEHYGDLLAEFEVGHGFPVGKDLIARFRLR